MKAVFIEAPGKAAVKEVPVPEIGDHDVLIKVKASGICGTDIHIYRGEYLGSYPIIPGHEFSGVVEKVGSKTSRIKVGDHVSVEPNISCGNCSACLNNRQNFCENWDGVGVTLPGGMAEYASAPEKAVFSIGDLSFLSGAFVEPLSCVLHGVQKTNIRLADNILIIGAGPIGILLSKALQLQGANIITQVDKNPSRLELARKSGAVYTESSLDSLEPDSFDVVVDASGVPFLMEQCQNYARKGGKVLYFGVPPKDAILKLPAFPIFEKGLHILSTFTSVRNSIQAVRLLASGRLDVEQLVSHQLPLEELEKGIDLIENGKEGVLKVIMKP